MDGGTWILVVVVFIVLSSLLKAAAAGHEAGMRYAGMEPLPGPAHTDSIIRLFFVGLVVVFFIWAAKGGG
jgi:hypothetical protein